MHSHANELLERDGVVRYPRIDRYKPGGVYLYEIVVCKDFVDRLTPIDIDKMSHIESFPIELNHGLDGTLTMRGFPRRVFSRERAEFEATEILYELWINTGLLLSIAESKNIKRAEEVYPTFF